MEELLKAFEIIKEEFNKLKDNEWERGYKYGVKAVSQDFFIKLVHTKTIQGVECYLLPINDYNCIKEKYLKE